jgi:chromosome segregation ATPase
VEENLTQSTSIVLPEVEGVSKGLQALWEAARKAADAIESLRNQRTSLSERVKALEGDISKIKSDLAKSESLVASLKEEKVQSETARAAVQFNGDREVLMAKVKDLLARIDGYL